MLVQQVHYHHLTLQRPAYGCIVVAVDDGVAAGADDGVADNDSSDQRR